MRSVGLVEGIWSLDGRHGMEFGALRFGDWAIMEREAGWTKECLLDTATLQTRQTEENMHYEAINLDFEATSAKIEYSGKFHGQTARHQLACCEGNACCWLQRYSFSVTSLSLVPFKDSFTGKNVIWQLHVIVRMVYIFSGQKFEHQATNLRFLLALLDKQR